MQGRSPQPNAKSLQKLEAAFRHGDTADAERLACEFVRKFPKHSFGWKVLGAIHQANNRFEASLEATNQSILFARNDAATHNNLAAALMGLARFAEALSSLNKALSIQPNYPQALRNLANLHRHQGRLNESAQAWRKLLELNAKDADAHFNLGAALELQNKLPEAQVYYKSALAISPNRPAKHSDLLYCLSHDVSTEPQALFEEHVAFGAQFESPLRAQWLAHDNTKGPGRRLQVGFVSGDFFDHALTNFLEPLYRGLSHKDELCLHAYSTSAFEDAVTERVRPYFAHWNAVCLLDDADLAQKIRADGIDVLLDLTGHTANNRLLTFARKPAPVQLSWLGYLGTSGLQAMDYYLCDRFWIPPGQLDWQFTEKVAYLPCAVVFEPNPLSPPVNALPAQSNGHITFGSFNRPNKLNSSVIALWAMLMREVPTAKMVLGGIPLDSQVALIQEFADAGIEHERLTFFPRTNTTSYLTLHHQVDFCLDTFPHGGGATTAHAVWMGVPSLSLAGESPASRFGATLMHHLGLDGFIATSIEDYVSKGLYWATHLDELANLRQTMRTRFENSPLGQPALFADNFDALLRSLWQTWCGTSVDKNALGEQEKSTSRKAKDMPAIKKAPQWEPTTDQLNKLAQLHRGNQLADAERLARQLTERFPEHGYAWKILGAVLLSQGRQNESLQVQQTTVTLRPEDHEAHFNLACGLQQAGRVDEAIRSYMQCLNLQPTNAFAYCNLGNIFKTRGLFAESEHYCREAILLRPDMSSAHNNLGNALHAQGKFKAAQASYEVALSLRPDWAEGYNNLAITQKDRGLWGDARASYAKALELSPNWAPCRSNLLYCLAHDVSVEPQELFAEHVAFGKQFEPPLRAEWLAHANDRDPNRLLQIGFVSGDFFDHALTSFLEPVYRALAQKNKLSLHAYSTSTFEDAVTQRVRPYFAHWNAVSRLSDAELAQKIRADGIDILIDLTGHTANNRLLTFARKPAPIQAIWLGYLGTSGLQAMDYYVCDRFWIPPGELDWQFTEKLAYLPSAVVFEPNPLSPPINPLPALTNGHITFGSFNRPNKLNSSVIALWAMLMREVPTSKMVLGGIALDSQVALLQEFEDAGIEHARLSFFPRTNTVSYLALHHQVDFCLDTFPHGGGATTAHAAWMGVPSLSLAGESPASRFGATLMHHLGLDGFIATSIEDYVSQGLYWATHLDELAELRQTMRTRFDNSPLGQPASFTNHFDDLLRSLWQTWCGPSAGTIAFEPANETPRSPPTEADTANTSLRKSPSIQIHIVSATKLSEDDFWKTSALGRSLPQQLQRNPNLMIQVAFNNSRGLPDIFNSTIEQADDDAILIFIHDDAWIDEPNLTDAVVNGLSKFDVIGVAGNRRRRPRQPAWAFIDTRWTWDEKVNLSGQVAHGKHPQGPISDFGPSPAECELLDGVFLATTKRRLGQQIRFDPAFDFHFYDMDFCRSARLQQLKLGTWPIALTHQSGGAFGSHGWIDKYEKYIAKWESNSTPLPLAPTAVATEAAQADWETSVKEALAMVQECKSKGDVKHARLLCMEVLKVQPRNADANAQLGSIEIEENNPESALPPLEIAVTEDAGNESHWVRYIDALSMCRPPEVVADALVLGQQFGLSTAMAHRISTDFLKRVEADRIANTEVQRAALEIPESSPESREQAKEPETVVTALLRIAVENDRLQNWQVAATLYRELLKSHPQEAEFNYRLGSIEARLNGATIALPHLEAAVQNSPGTEAYWVTYIEALLASGAVETAASALEWGQKYGLTQATAERISGECVNALERILQPEINSVYSEAELAVPPPPPWPEPRPSLQANLDYIKEPRTKNRRYVIYAPLYRHNSAGIRVLFELQKWLILAGQDAIVVAMATNGYAPGQFSDDIVIYPEVVAGNPLKALRVVRYLLNVPGKLAGTKKYASHELLIAYSAALEQYSAGKILQTPSIESIFYIDGRIKTINAVYIGKAQDLHRHPDDCVYITGNFPATRLEVAEFMRSVKTLYTYDSFSVIAHEAMECGCEVKLIDKDGTINNFPDPCHTPLNEFKAQLHDFIEMTKLL
jgi:predicted O-linked N-acetylglucosamine transferase (SPINDLY family)